MKATQRTALSTGGATGIGYATARRLARDGSAVLSIGPDVRQGQAAEAELRAEGAIGLSSFSGYAARRDQG
ncbi:MAG: SDR family NAD(P)-dependent oxidoreductase [Chloroflexota bacterium]|nr:SDR family NAD(P)-dependent oxidoreductase [Chloroflexota bacterium]PLS77591.1 MAG: hypothetical protein CYG59_22995 [Chloroflexota bacterium]